MQINALHCDTTVSGCHGGLRDNSTAVAHRHDTQCVSFTVACLISKMSPQTASWLWSIVIEVLTAMCGANIDHGVLAVGFGTDCRKVAEFFCCFVHRYKAGGPPPSGWGRVAQMPRTCAEVSDSSELGASSGVRLDRHARPSQQPEPPPPPHPTPPTLFVVGTAFLPPSFGSSCVHLPFAFLSFMPLCLLPLPPSFFELKVLSLLLLLLSVGAPFASSFWCGAGSHLSFFWSGAASPSSSFSSFCVWEGRREGRGRRGGERRGGKGKGGGCFPTLGGVVPLGGADWPSPFWVVLLLLLLLLSCCCC